MDRYLLVMVFQPDGRVAETINAPIHFWGTCFVRRRVQLPIGAMQKLTVSYRLFSFNDTKISRAKWVVLDKCPLMDKHKKRWTLIKNSYSAASILYA